MLSPIRPAVSGCWTDHLPPSVFPVMVKFAVILLLKTEYGQITGSIVRNVCRYWMIKQNPGKHSITVWGGGSPKLQSPARKSDVVHAHPQLQTSDFYPLLFHEKGATLLALSGLGLKTMQKQWRVRDHQSHCCTNKSASEAASQQLQMKPHNSIACSSQTV